MEVSDQRRKESKPGLDTSSGSHRDSLEAVCGPILIAAQDFLVRALRSKAQCKSLKESSELIQERLERLDNEVGAGSPLKISLDASHDELKGEEDAFRDKIWGPETKELRDDVASSGTIINRSKPFIQTNSITEGTGLLDKTVDEIHGRVAAIRTRVGLLEERQSEFSAWLKDWT